MKKIVTIVLFIFSVCSIAAFSANAQQSPLPINYYSVETSVLGSGQASCDTNKIEVESGYTCTFTAVETDEKFAFWNIKADDYDIISGNYDELVFTIRPKSDVIAIATFESGVYEKAVPVRNQSIVSPQTGDRSTVYIVIVLMIAIAGFLIFFSKKKVICAVSSAGENSRFLICRCGVRFLDGVPNMLVWWNWQTHSTQNATGNRVGSSPTTSTTVHEKVYLLPTTFCTK